MSGALVAGLAFFAYLGWDAPLWNAADQALLHVIGLLGAVALGAVVWSRGSVPRTPLDLPILALLAAFTLAALLSENQGLALRALASILATVVVLPMALLVLRARPQLVALVVLLPVLAGATPILVEWLSRRVAWYVAGGPGILPPVRLASDHAGAWGAPAVPAFVIVAAAPLTLLVSAAWLRLGLQVALVLLGVPLVVLGGSRAAWLAIAVALGLLVLPVLPRLRAWRPVTAARRSALFAGSAIVALLAFAIAPRLAQFTSLFGRGRIWQDTLEAWSASPWVGIGPGLMPYARQAASDAESLPTRVPHSHSVPLGILGDAGVVGLLAGAIVVAVFLARAGPWAQRSLAGRGAAAAATGLMAGALFDDLTFLPAFNVLVLLLVAVSLHGASAVSWQVVELPSRRLAAAVIAACVLGAGALAVAAARADVAATAYRRGVDAAALGDWTRSAVLLRDAATIDPWHPGHWKSLAVSAFEAGEVGAARAAAERAIALNAGDTGSWVNLALMCERTNDMACARRSARGAIDVGARASELVNAAQVLDRLGDTSAADAAWNRALLTDVRTALAVTWPRVVEPGGPLRGQLAHLGPTAELNEVIARRALGFPTDPERYAEPAVRALAFAFVGDPDTARQVLSEAAASRREQPLTWDVMALLQAASGEDASRAQRLAELTRSSPPVHDIPSVTYDVASFRAYPRDGLISIATRLRTPRPWPWSIEPLLSP